MVKRDGEPLFFGKYVRWKHHFQIGIQIQSTNSFQYV